MPASPPNGASALDALLADLGPRIRRGGEAIQEALPFCPTGLADIDDLLGGGFPRARLSEVTGPPSSGRTSIGLALLASITSRGECAALVDLSDAFDPNSAEASGVDLDRLLWVRPSEWRDALRCCERLLQTDGFPLVILDVPADVRPGNQPAALLRLSRLATSTRAAMVVASCERLAGSQSAVVLEMQCAKPRFSGTPSLLEGLEVRAVLVRHRTAPVHRSTALRLSAA